MKKLILIVCAAFFLSSCSTSGDNNVTEVGNPQGTSTTNKTLVAGATLQIMNASLTGLADNLPAPLDGELVRNLSYATSGTTDFSCSFDEDSRTLICDCPVSGSFELALDSESERDGGTITVATDFTMALDACSLTVCDESIIHDGSYTGTLTGTLSIATRDLAVTFDAASISTCGELTHNTDTTYGFGIGFGFDGGAVTADGTLCVDGEEITFEDIADLASQVDPDDACEEAFAF